MPRCNKCPINKECRDAGGLKIVKKNPDGSEQPTPVCPLLFAIDYAIQSAQKEAKLKTREGSQ